MSQKRVKELVNTFIKEQLKVLEENVGESNLAFFQGDDFALLSREEFKDKFFSQLKAGFIALRLDDKAFKALEKVDSTIPKDKIRKMVERNKQSLKELEHEEAGENISRQAEIEEDIRGLKSINDVLEEILK